MEVALLLVCVLVLAGMGTSRTRGGAGIWDPLRERIPPPPKCDMRQ